MRRIARGLEGVGMVAAVLWVLAFGFFGVVTLFVVPAVGLLALAIAALPPVAVFFLWLGSVGSAPLAAAHPVGLPTPHLAAGGPVGGQGGRGFDTSRATRAALEPGLLTALDLAVPIGGPAAGAPWMPVAVESPSPPALRALAADGSVLPMLAEAGVVLAGPGPQQAVRHMIGAYEPQVAEQALSAGQGNHFGAFGGAVAVLERTPDTLWVGDVRTTIRVVAATGTVSHVVVWRRGPLVAHVAVSGEETLAHMLLAHATRVADSRLLQVLAALSG